jgi:hypothetical protein
MSTVTAGDVTAELARRIEAQGLSLAEVAAVADIPRWKLSRRLADGSALLISELFALSVVLGTVPSEIVAAAEATS